MGRKYNFVWLLGLLALVAVPAFANTTIRVSPTQWTVPHSKDVDTYRVEVNKLQKEIDKHKNDLTLVFESPGTTYLFSKSLNFKKFTNVSIRSESAAANLDLPPEQLIAPSGQYPILKASFFGRRVDDKEACITSQAMVERYPAPAIFWFSESRYIDITHLSFVGGYWGTGDIPEFTPDNVMRHPTCSINEYPGNAIIFDHSTTDTLVKHNDFSQFPSNAVVDRTRVFKSITRQPRDCSPEVYASDEPCTTDAIGVKTSNLRMEHNLFFDTVGAINTKGGAAIGRVTQNKIIRSYGGFKIDGVTDGTVNGETSGWEIDNNLVWEGRSGNGVAVEENVRNIHVHNNRFERFYDEAGGINISSSVNGGGIYELVIERNVFYHFDRTENQSYGIRISPPTPAQPFDAPIVTAEIQVRIEENVFQDFSSKYVGISAVPSEHGIRLTDLYISQNRFHNVLGTTVLVGTKASTCGDRCPAESLISEASMSNNCFVRDLEQYPRPEGFQEYLEEVDDPNNPDSPLLVPDTAGSNNFILVDANTHLNLDVNQFESRHPRRVRFFTETGQFTNLYSCGTDNVRIYLNSDVVDRGKACDADRGFAPCEFVPETTPLN